MPLFQREPQGLDKFLGERVIVLPNGDLDTLGGVLVGNYADSIELASPAVVDGDDRFPTRGPGVVLKDRIWFVHRDV